MLLKCAIVFKKIFNYFCLFLVLTIIIGQQNFLILDDGLNDRTSETKIGFEQKLVLNIFSINPVRYPWLLKKLVIGILIGFGLMCKLFFLNIVTSVFFYMI